MRWNDDEKRRRTEPLPFETEQARRLLAPFFAGYPEAHAAYLFGSRARGNVRPSSDVDIAVWVDPSLPSVRHLDLRLEWMDRIPTALGYPDEVDVIILNDAPPALAWDVVRAPVVLYEAVPDAAGEVALRLRKVYRDELPRLERRRQRLLASIEQGEFGVGYRTRRAEAHKDRA